jgi:hypothetical protein
MDDAGFVMTWTLHPRPTGTAPACRDCGAPATATTRAGAAGMAECLCRPCRNRRRVAAMLAERATTLRARAAVASARAGARFRAPPGPPVPPVPPASAGAGYRQRLERRLKAHGLA